MKSDCCVFLIVSFASLITGNLITQLTFGQSDVVYEITKELDQKNMEKFLELAEEKFRKVCYKSNNIDNKVGEDITRYLPKDLVIELCEDKINKIKNQTGTLQQNQTIDSVTGETTYTTHNDYSNGFTFEYPKDWHISSDGEKIPPKLPT